jgi:hypothetical protein
MSIPALKGEINFGGTWYDVSTYTGTSVAQIHVGRTSEFTDVGPATLSGIQLDNDDGRFTPLCDLLVDGVTPNPYYPNVLPRAQIRLSYTISATTYYFYWGYVQSWPPMMRNGDNPYVPITAVDGLSLLSGFDVSNGGPAQSMLTDGPVALYPFNDPSGTTAWAELVNNALLAVPADQLGSGTATYTSGSDSATPYADGQTGLTVDNVPTGTEAGWQTPALSLPTAANTTWTLESWFKVAPDSSTGDYPDVEVKVTNSVNTTLFITAQTNFVAATRPQVTLNYFDAANSITSHTPYQISDDVGHLYSLTGSDNGTNLTVNFYVDGVLIETRTGTSGSGTLGSTGAAISGQAFSDFTANPSVTFGPAAFFAKTLPQLTVALHAAAGTGGVGYTTGQLITEYLRWCGFTSSAIATGVQSVAGHSVAGKTILQLCQDMAKTEGGGATFYVDMNNNQFTFFDRHYRSTTTPLFTVDGDADLDGTQYAPAFDSLTLINQSVISRSGGPAQVYTDQASKAQYGLASDSSGGTVYTDTDTAALNLAQYRVAANRNPGFRVGKLVIDLTTAMTSGLFAAFGQMKVGSRLRVNNLVAARSAPLATVDVYAEGWTLTAGQTQFTAAIDTTPADNPRRGPWGTMRWAPITGDSKLNAVITAAVTALAIKWTAGPQWTITAGSYPLIIQIDQEQIQLNGVPSGSTSPQSWTGVTRGVNGTRAAPHSANAVISLVNGNWQL